MQWVNAYSLLHLVSQCIANAFQPLCFFILWMEEVALDWISLTWNMLPNTDQHTFDMFCFQSDVHGLWQNCTAEFWVFNICAMVHVFMTITFGCPISARTMCPRTNQKSRYFYFIFLQKKNWAFNVTKVPFVTVTSNPESNLSSQRYASIAEHLTVISLLQKWCLLHFGMKTRPKIFHPCTCLKENWCMV